MNFKQNFHVYILLRNPLHQKLHLVTEFGTCMKYVFRIVTLWVPPPRIHSCIHLVSKDRLTIIVDVYSIRAKAIIMLNLFKRYKRCSQGARLDGKKHKAHLVPFLELKAQRSVKRKKVLKSSKAQKVQSNKKCNFRLF